MITEQAVSTDGAPDLLFSMPGGSSEHHVRDHSGDRDSDLLGEGRQEGTQVMATMSATAWRRTVELAERDGLGDAQVFALSVGCPLHGNAAMDWDDAGVFCHQCEIAAKEEQVMAETCHCGSPMRGSDHCPWCGCEEMESTCGLQWDGKS